MLMDDASTLINHADPVVAPVVGSALAAAEADPEVRGLFVTGSLARAERYPGADIDLHALVVDGAGRVTQVDTVGGVMVETAYCWDEPKFVRRLEDEPSTVYGLIEGRVIYDPDGRIARLRAAAQRRLHDYEPSADDSPAPSIGCAVPGSSCSRPCGRTRCSRHRRAPPGHVAITVAITRILKVATSAISTKA